MELYPVSTEIEIVQVIFARSLRTPSHKQGTHYYQLYRNTLVGKLNDGVHIEYRILPWNGAIPDKAEDLSPDSPLMRFCAPFIQQLGGKEYAYRQELAHLMSDIKDALRPTAPVIHAGKGFLVISHPHMGFLGVYDALSGHLRIRGMKILESVFLEILHSVCDLIQPLPDEADRDNVLLRLHRYIIRKSLASIHSNHSDTYKQVFFLGQEVSCPRECICDCKTMRQLGILEEELTVLSSKYLVFPLGRTS